MIKKFFTLAIAGMMSVATLSAQQPILKWAALQDTPMNEIAVDIASTPDGCTYVLNDFSSKEGSLEANYSYVYLKENVELGKKPGDIVIENTIKGSVDPLGSDDGCISMALHKIDKNGHHLWSLNTNRGDFSGKGKIVSMSDGSILLGLKMRNTDFADKNSVEYDDYMKTLARFVDKDNVETVVKWSNDSNRWTYQPVFVKVSAEGKIEWTKHIPVGTTFEGASNAQKVYNDCFKINDMAVDENDNIYVVGNFSTSINFGEKANFTKARNVYPTWDGDTQDGAPKDLFIVKLDKDFNAIWGSKLEGESITSDVASNVVYSNGKLIVSGHLRGDGKTVVKLGNNEYTPERQSLFYASVNPGNGKIEWGKFLPINTLTSVSKPFMKPMDSSIYDDNVYFCGQFKGEITDGDKVILSNGLDKLHGYIIQANATTGNITGSIHTQSQNPSMANKDILEVESVYETPKKIFATGYGLFTDSYIYVFDKNLTPESMEVYIAKKSFFGSSQCSTISGTMLVNAMRGKKSVTFPDANVTINLQTSGNKQFGCVYTGHDIDKLSSVAENLADNDFKVIGGVNEVIVETVEACDIYVYNMMGCLVASQSVEEGKTVIALEKGIYLVNGVKTVVR